MEDGRKRNLLDIVKVRIASMTGVYLGSKDKVAVPKAGTGFK